MSKSMNMFLLILFTSFSLSISASELKYAILDTDIGPDYDDVAAMAVLHTLADMGEVKILATIGCNKYEGIASVINIFNTYFNRSDIPIGIPKGEAVNMNDEQNWTPVIIKRYPHQLKSNSEAEDAITVYRRVLSSQPDKSVTLITIGFLTNLANLLETKADKFSQLNGLQLIKQKVKKLVTMAGSFPKGTEFNMELDSKASKKVFDIWPTPVIFSGFEIGTKILTGLPILNNKELKNSPVKDVFDISFPLNISMEQPNGRPSWDPVTVLTAIRGYEPYFDVINGSIIVNSDGSNNWNTSGSRDSYIIEKLPVINIEKILNDLMMR